MTIQTVVLGASGYVGGELLRLVHGHPTLELAAAVSRSFTDQPIRSIFPHLAPICGDAKFSAPDAWPDQIPDGSQLAIFSAAPHGASAQAIAAAVEAADARGLDVHVVDCSADFRFSDPALFKSVYGDDHPALNLLGDFICAVPEHTSELRKHAAHPGCFVTSALVAAVPLVNAGVISGDLFFNGVTGSTGAGRSPVPGTHHPERHGNLYAYKPLAHRHSPEIGHLLQSACGKQIRPHFVPHSGPFARGIHMTLHAALDSSVDRKAILEIFRSYYAERPFINVVDGEPRMKDVVTSNQCYIGAAVDDRAVSVFCVIDNLIKGAAGGAMQWMNRMWSLSETAGLESSAPGWT